MHGAYLNVSAKVAPDDDDDTVVDVILGKESLQFRSS
jgi:hypothetical protein